MLFPFLVFGKLQQIHSFCLTVQDPEMAFLVELYAVNQYIVISQFLASSIGSSQRTIVYVIVTEQFAILEFIESASATSEDVVFVCWVDIDAVYINISVACLILQFIFKDGPVIIMIDLYGARMKQIRHS